MTLCGHLHYTGDRVDLISDLIEDCGISYKLPPGMPINTALDKIPYAGCLDYKYSANGRLDWTIVGTNLWGSELDGLEDVRVPFYVKIERDDGAVFDLENPGTLCNENFNKGRHFYRYADMSIKEAISMHINGILNPISEDSTWILKMYIESLLSNALRLDIDVLDMVRETCANSKRNLSQWPRKVHMELIKHWIEFELKPKLGYPPSQLDTRTMITHELEEEIYGSLTRPIEMPGVPIRKEETPITTIITPTGKRYIGDVQV